MFYLFLFHFCVFSVAHCVQMKIKTKSNCIGIQEARESPTTPPSHNPVYKIEPNQDSDDLGDHYFYLSFVTNIFIFLILLTFHVFLFILYFLHLYFMLILVIKSQLSRFNVCLNLFLYFLFFF